MTSALSAWWWTGRPNFGDALNPAILEYVAKRPVKRVTRDKAEIFGFGSIMGAVRDRIRTTKTPVYVWGAGMMRPIARGFAKNVAFTCVRGPITASLLGLDDAVAQGDPGLLAPEALDVYPPTVKKWRIGIVPHIVHFDLPVMAQLHDALPNSTVINLLSDDVHTTLQQISECEVILSSSLHGLIVADALNIPNIWLEPKKLNKFSRFKFFDYGLSVGREMRAPMPMQQALSMTGAPDIPTGYFANIPAVQQTIRDSFPAELAA